MSRDEFDSSSTLYEYIVFLKMYFSKTLSYIEIGEFACSLCQLIGVYVRHSSLS